MSSAPAKASLTVIPVPEPSALSECRLGEVLWTTFRGDPLVTFHDVEAKRGGAVIIERARMEEDFRIFLEQMRKVFGEDALGLLQIKIVLTHQDEAKVRELATRYGIRPSSFAVFDDKSRLDCYFYSDSGRLRAAPTATPNQNPKVTTPGTLFQPPKKIRVLIVDDSRTIRSLLKNIISGSPDLEVVGEADRPSQVEALIESLKPDVMTLDINMPERSGVELLSDILVKRFLPTVMISSLNIDQGNEVLDALEIGAVDYIHKPAGDELAIWTPIIQEKIANAAKVQKKREPHLELVQGKDKVSPAPKAKPIHPSTLVFESTGVIAIGASTGGTEAIRRVLLALPEKIPPILIVQHIPPYFSTAFAKRLNDLCKFEVLEAKDGDEIKPNRVLIAPGGLHMEARMRAGQLYVHVYAGKPVNRFMPSVDVLFESVAKNIGKSARGVILTGMGSDGAKGLLAMKDVGSITIAQDEESSVVYGMPRAAFEKGAVTHVKHLDAIADTLIRLKPN